MSVGERLRSARKRRRLTQKQLAELLGVAQSAIVLWEKGETLPRPMRWARIEEVLGVKVALRDVTAHDEAKAS